MMRLVLQKIIRAMDQQIHALVCGNHLSLDKSAFHRKVKTSRKVLPLVLLSGHQAGFLQQIFFNHSPERQKRNISNIRCQQLFVINRSFKEHRCQSMRQMAEKKPSIERNHERPLYSHSFSIKKIFNKT